MQKIYDINGNLIYSDAEKKASQDFISNTDLPFNNSAMTIIDDVLYCFPYTSANTNVNTTGAKFRVNGDGTLTSLDDTFISNFGHNNTVDFNSNNRYLLSTNGGNSISTQPNKIYLMGPYQEGNIPNNFLVKDSIQIDVSQEGWGKQPNAIWADTNIGANDMIFVFTNYEKDNMTNYDVANVDNFSGESKRIIHKLQLGKGSNNLGKGTMNSVSADMFNGTYKEIGSWEYPFVYADAINDMCFYNGHIYHTIVGPGLCIRELSFDDYNTALIIKDRKIDWYNSVGVQQSNENEGIAIKDGILYIGNPKAKIKSFWLNLIP